jgi:uncharacterized membrane protein
VGRPVGGVRAPGGKIRLVADPAYVHSCSISPLLSCGSVMSTARPRCSGSLNPVLGVAGFAALVTVAVTVLSGTRLPSWYWIGLTVGTGLGTVFVDWLIFQSLYRIGALCPYCMVVWVVTVSALVAVLARWSRAGALPPWVGELREHDRRGLDPGHRRAHRHPLLGLLGHPLVGWPAPEAS